MKDSVWRILAVAACGGALGWSTSERSVAIGNAFEDPELVVTTTESVSETAWALLAKQLAEADATTCEREYGTLLKSDWSAKHALLLEAWLVRWMELDGESALAYVKEAAVTKGYRAWHTETETEAKDLWERTQSRQEQFASESGYEWYRQWARRDPKAALRKAKTFDDSSERNAALRGVVAGWIEAAPDDALAWAVTQLENPDDVLRMALHHAAESGHLHEAIAAVKDIRHHRMLSQTTFVRHWQATDLEAAAQWLASQPSDPKERLERTRNRIQYLLSQSNSGTPKIQAEFVLRFAELAGHRLHGPSSRQNLGFALKDFAQRDPKQALERLGTLPVSVIDNWTVGNFAGGWASVDGPAAVTWAASLNDDRVMGHVIRAWTMDDPVVAAAWVREQGDTNNCVATVLEAWPANRMAEAVDWLVTMPEEDQAQGVSSVASRWANENWKSAAVWVDQIEPGPVRNRAVHGYLERFHNQASEGFATAWALLGSVEVKEDTSWYSALVWRWAEFDAESAAVSLDEGQVPQVLMAEAHKAVGRYLGYQNTNAAAKWVHSLESEARDHAAFGYAQSWVNSGSHWHGMTPRPESALPWVEIIEDHELRKQGYEMVFGYVLKEAEDAFRNTLSGEAKTLFEARLRDRAEETAE